MQLLRSNLITRLSRYQVSSKAHHGAPGKGELKLQQLVINSHHYLEYLSIRLIVAEFTIDKVILSKSKRERLSLTSLICVSALPGGLTHTNGNSRPGSFRD
jgi:hypothetical protein